MKFSISWLYKWISSVTSISNLINDMNRLGLEVEYCKLINIDFSGIVVGKVISYFYYKKCCVLEIDIGSRILYVFSYAKKIKVNLNILVACINSFIFKKYISNLINKYSFSFEGIACSFFLLGLSDINNNEIIKVSSALPIGNNISKYFIVKDYILTVNVNSNRGDCLSIRGIAKDISSLNYVFLQNFRKFLFKINKKFFFSIFIKEYKKCPRYLGRVIKNINIKAITPLWIQEKLIISGIKLFDVVTNIVNYVLLDIGQPIRIYDLDKIDKKIIVRVSNHNEQVIVSDGKKIILQKNILVVSDCKNILSIAGVCSSLNSSVTSKTRHIFVECAFFLSQYVLETSKLLNFFDISSIFYQKGIDYHLQNYAIDYFTYLLCKICDGEVGPIINKTYKKYLPISSKIKLDYIRLNYIIGYSLSKTIIYNILKKLYYKIRKYKYGWLVVVPFWRFDIKIVEDLVEDIIRIYGYDKLLCKKLFFNLKFFTSFYSDTFLQKSKNLLVNKGYQEIITYTFVSSKIQSLLYPNIIPLSLNKNVLKGMLDMRLSLFSGLIKTLIDNQKYNLNRVRLFESGFCYIPDISSYLKVRQSYVISGIISGRRFELNWNTYKDNVDFYDIKGDVESIINLSGNLDRLNFIPYKYNFFCSGQSAKIFIGNIFIGLIGLIHPKIQSILNIRKKFFLFEIFLKEILQINCSVVKKISKFPLNYRDISFFVPKNILIDFLIKECKKIISDKLIDILLFDVFDKKSIPLGYKSISLRLILQEKTSTLTENKISLIIYNCIKHLENKFNIIFRDKCFF